MLNLASGRVRLGGKQRGLQLFKAAGVPGPSNAYRDAVLADSPLAYYRLDETSGTTLVDSSGNSRSGTYSGAYTLNQTGLVGAGVNPAVLFGGGLASAATVADLAALSFITVEAWVKPSDVVGGSKIVVGRSNLGSTASGNNYQAFLSQRNAQWSLTVRAGTGVVDLTQPSDSAAVGKVQHVVGTYDGSTMRLYVDGMEVANVAKTGALSSGGTNPLTIGSANFAGQRFAGVIDEVAYYGTALTPTRIAAHYAAGIAG